MTPAGTEAGSETKHVGSSAGTRWATTEPTQPAQAHVILVEYKTRKHSESSNLPEYSGHVQLSLSDYF